MSNESPKKKSKLLTVVLPLFLVLVVIAGALYATQNYWKPLIGPEKEQTGDIRGLAVKNELLSDIPGDQAAMMSRIAFMNLSDFFYNEMSAFVVARVTQAVELPAADAEFDPGRVQVTLEVLDWVFGKPENAPVSITIIQNRLGGCTLEEQTNLLRQGGAYLLPLAEYEGDYWLMGDFDVLFEVDNQGMLYSHSDMEAFKAYDGKAYTLLLGDVRMYIQNNPLLQTAPRFARVLREGTPLIEVTVTGEAVSVPPKAPESFEVEQFSRQLKVERVLRQGKDKSVDTATIDLVFYKEEADLLQQGGRYLMFVSWVDLGDGNPYYQMELNRIAAVAADGTITPVVQDGNAFHNLTGKTVDQVQELIK